MDEFGNGSVAETLDIRITSPDAIEREHRPIHTERIDLDEYPWAGRSLEEMESALPIAETQGSGNLSSRSSLMN